MSSSDVSLRHSAPSPNLRDKIRLFEGRGSTPQLVQHTPNGIYRTVSSGEFRSNSSYRGPRLSPSRSIVQNEKDRSVVGESSRKRLHELPIPLTTSTPTLTTTTTTSTTTLTTHEVPSIPVLRGLSAITPEVPTISPRKWNVITLEPEHQITTTTTTSPNATSSYRDKGKEKERVAVLSLDYDKEAIDSGEESSPKIQLPTLAKSPRRPSIEQKYEEEVVKLKKMTAEEREMIKVLIKLTTRKNKMMDALETNIHRERQALEARVEAEKGALSAKLQALDLELATRSRELSAETMRNNDLTEKIQKLERERQDIRMALAASKRESRQCKINCDAELNKKTQSLMDMAMQLTALTCLRQSMNCVICEEKVATAVLLPCRHMVMCGTCSQKVTKCPMCRVDIRNKFEIYNNWVI
eukprot:Phypoly_transcript_08514.p1 GENE.Phypoly_transcript_08514~~Phypoly_transcript_08514.p1  ORF type:complete len:412 (+),score=67.98 Phypoly_transcript_08514:166-1401(+)